MVKDKSGVGGALDLGIENAGGATWVPEGGLIIDGWRGACVFGVFVWTYVV